MKPNFEQFAFTASFETASNTVWNGVHAYMAEMNIGDALADIVSTAMTEALARLYAPNDNTPFFYLLSLQNPAIYMTKDDSLNVRLLIEKFQDIILLCRTSNVESEQFYDVYVGTMKSLVGIGLEKFRGLPLCLASDLRKLFLMSRKDIIDNPYYKFQGFFFAYLRGHKWADKDFEDHIHDAAEALTVELAHMGHTQRNGFLFVNISLDPRGVYRNAYETTVGQVARHHVLCIVSVNHDIGGFSVLTGTIEEILCRLDYEGTLPVNFNPAALREQFEKLNKEGNS